MHQTPAAVLLEGKGMSCIGLLWRPVWLRTEPSAQFHLACFDLLHRFLVWLKSAVLFSAYKGRTHLILACTVILDRTHLILAGTVIFDNTLTNGSLCLFCQLASLGLPLLHNVLDGSLGR